MAKKSKSSTGDIAQAVEPGGYVFFPDNPRIITEQELLKLEESMAEYGSLDGFVINRSEGKYKNVIVSGNQKAREIGLENFKPEIVEEFKNPTDAGTLRYGFVEYKSETFPYREVWWSEQKCLTANLRANNMGGHNDATLLEKFGEDVLRKAGIDMEQERMKFNFLQNLLLTAPVAEETFDEQAIPNIDPELLVANTTETQSNIYQIFLHYKREDYEQLLQEIERLNERYGLTNNSDLVLKLIGLYESNHSNTEF